MQKNVIMTEKYLYCYIMTHDTGFAPNPEHGFLTLATCKPKIRKCAEIGTWISGWAGMKVFTTEDRKKYVDWNAQKLVYLAEITNKMSIADYWHQYPEKRPHCVNGIYDMGDNIYEPINENEYEHHKNGGGHGPDNKSHDLSGLSVLLSTNFYYFGVENAIPINVDDKFVVPRCKKIVLDNIRAKRIIAQVVNNYNPGIIIQSI